MKGLLVVLALVLSIAVANAAPLLAADSETAVPDQYIVVFHKTSTTILRDLHVTSLREKRFSGDEKIINTFAIGDFIGYSAVLSAKTLKEELQHPNIRYIERDQVVSINEGYASQTNLVSGLWGIDRTDQKALPLNQTYFYFNSGGENVNAYVIDTGVLTTHDEFRGRAIAGFNGVTGEANTDLNGHGTHVAGTIGGTTYGLAKKVNIIASKVLNAQGSGTIAGVVSGVAFVTDDHNKKKEADSTTASVANMSLGGSAAQALDDAVVASIAAGVHYSIAAGNSNANACNYSPARVATAVTVGATTNVDARASFSNFGTCVTVFAPGNAILSSYIGSNTATASLSGTSMAAPHVAGAIAVRLGNIKNNKGALPTTAELKGWIASTGTKDVVTGPGTGSPNILLFSPWTEPTPTLPPTSGARF